MLYGIVACVAFHQIVQAYAGRVPPSNNVAGFEDPTHQNVCRTYIHNMLLWKQASLFLGTSSGLTSSHSMEKSSMPTGRGIPNGAYLKLGSFYTFAMADDEMYVRIAVRLRSNSQMSTLLAYLPVCKYEVAHPCTLDGPTGSSIARFSRWLRKELRCIKEALRRLSHPPRTRSSDTIWLDADLLAQDA